MNYQNHYTLLIEKTKLEERRKNKEIYYEWHHIIPECLNGPNTKENLVLLTGREHYIAHWLLWKATNNYKLKLAFGGMALGAKRRKLNSRQFERARTVLSEAKQGVSFSEQHKTNLKIAQNKRFLESPVSEETRKKLSDAAKGRILTEETRECMSRAAKGKPKSEKHKESLKEAWKSTEYRERSKGIPRSEEAIENMKKGWEKRKLVPVSEETRKKISEALKGRTVSEETRRLLSEANKNREVTEKRLASYTKGWETRRLKKTKSSEQR